MRLDHNHHLAYCTNIHPAESWEETWQALRDHTLQVRDRVQQLPGSEFPLPTSNYAIGLRLSARAADELLTNNQLAPFQAWLEQENCYVFTINGFPYGAFHGTRVKENVYRPDWTTQERLIYTKQLFDIIAALCPTDSGGSVSTLPGSFKEFNADEDLIFTNLYSCAEHIAELSKQSGKELHLGLEPEPLGHFENTEETLAFFDRFFTWANNNSKSKDLIKQRIGINYDTCHFALEFDDCETSLQAFQNAGLRISKVHLSSALEFNPSSAEALESIKQFDEPTYLHQVIINDGDKLTRHKDLPNFSSSLPTENCQLKTQATARCHFHIPLYQKPTPPLASTQQHVRDLLAYRQQHPDFCTHYEIETYTWGVLPGDLQKDLTTQIAEEYQWVLNNIDLIGRDRSPSGPRE